MGDRHMSDMEAMMWNVERDPWLDPNGGSISLFDRPLDVGWFRRSMRRAVVDVPRLRQRVEAGLAPLSTPRWVHDHEFDLDWHVRQIGAPGAGSLRELLDYFTVWLQDPYDRTRPLWMYVVVDGLADGRGALLAKIHHAVGDGETLVKMSLAYTTTKRGRPPAEVDLDAVVDGAPVEPVGVVAAARDALGQGLSWPADLGRRLLRTVTQPGEIRRTGAEAVDLAKTANEQRHPAGSDLWRHRSRRRRMEALSLDFDAVHDASHAFGGTINDFFLTGAVEAAVRYHDDVDRLPDKLHVTLVVNTHNGDDDTANAFSPVPIEVSGQRVPLAERFGEVHALAHTRRSEVHGSGPMATMAPVANLVPTPLMTGLARDQAGHIDFATSNLPGLRSVTYVAGARTLHCYPFGPVAGTAFNLTMISTANVLDLGLHLDPAAVTDPGRLVTHLRDAYDDLLALA